MFISSGALLTRLSVVVVCVFCVPSLATEVLGVSSQHWAQRLSGMANAVRTVSLYTRHVVGCAGDTSVLLRFYRAVVGKDTRRN